MPISLILHLQERNGNPLQYSCLENSMGYSPWGHKELDITERLHFHFHFSRKEIGLPGGLVVKNLPAMQETWVPSLVGKIPQRRKRQHTPVFLPGKCHGQRSLAGYSPWDCKRVRHNLVTKTKTKAKTNNNKKEIALTSLWFKPSIYVIYIVAQYWGWVHIQYM